MQLVQSMKLKMVNPAISGQWETAENCIIKFRKDLKIKLLQINPEITGVYD